jgi:multisubunit Na+/H+ antiporter MnhB subunit
VVTGGDRSPPDSGPVLSYARMPKQNPSRGAATDVISLLMIVIGVALVVRTLAAGGGALASGLILGVLFVAAGAGRMYLRRMTR